MVLAALLRRVVCLLAAGSIAVLSAAAPAMANTPSPDVTTSVNKTIQASRCSHWTHWEGQNYDTDVAANYSPYGSVRHCVWRLRLQTTKRSHYNYFLVYAKSEYTLKGGSKKMDAKAWIFIKSSRQASSGVYDASDSYTSSSDCSSGPSVSVGIGPLSASFSPKLCDDFRVERLYRHSDGAGYRTDHVGGVRHFDSAFLIKVPKGSSTSFKVSFWKPAFEHRNNGLHWIESGGYSRWKTTL